MADLYNVPAVGLDGGVTIGANARRLIGDGTNGVGPYTRLGTPQLQAIRVVSATVDFSLTPSAPNSNLYRAVSAIQNRAEVYYVGIPGDLATGFVVLVHLNKTDAGDGFGPSAVANVSYENLEDAIRESLGTPEDNITITNVALSGLTFA